MVKIKVTKESIPIITKQLMEAIKEYQSLWNYSMASRTDNVTEKKLLTALRDVKTGCKLLEISVEQAIVMYENAQQETEQP